MGDLNNKTDLEKWSLDEKKVLLSTILKMAEDNKKSYKTFETSIKWDTIQVDGKSGDECKDMYQRLVHRVRKFRTMVEIVTDAMDVVADDPVKTNANEPSDLPKKPPTAFSLFLMRRSKKFPDVKGVNRIKVFANDWNELTEEKKESYKRKYMKLKRKYDADLDVFRQNHPDYLVPGSGAPQPPSPCKIFVESRLERIKNKEPELSHAEAVKKLTIKYKKLSDKKKLKWINKAKNCLQSYQNQCDVYLSHNPKSTVKPAVLHLSKEEQRILNASRGKPVTAPAKNLFMYFCNTRRDNFLHMTVSEQNKHLSAAYHQLSEDELTELKDRFIQGVGEYVRSYTEYFQSLSESERRIEKSLDEALTQYNKILENDRKSKVKKMKKESKDKVPKPEQKNKKKPRLSDVLPLPREDNDDVDDSSDSTPSVDVIAPQKRKIETENEPATPHKKKKKHHQEVVSPSIQMVASSDDLLSMWSPLRTPAPSNEDPDTSANSKSHKKAKRLKV